MNFDELIQKEEEALLRDLRELVRIPSVSVPGTGRAPYGAECRRALDWFLSRASEMGFQTRDVDGHCGWCEYGEGEEMVAVLCHLDVVPAGDGWHYPPYDCTWAGGRIYGRGVIDDKGPAAAALYALKAVRDSGAPLHRRVRLLVGCNEEKGSSCIRHYVAVSYTHQSRMLISRIRVPALMRKPFTFCHTWVSMLCREGRR